MTPLTRRAVSHYDAYRCACSLMRYERHMTAWDDDNPIPYFAYRDIVAEAARLPYAAIGAAWLTYQAQEPLYRPKNRILNMAKYQPRIIKTKIEKITYAPFPELEAARARKAARE